jgi:hypothetical protein
MVLNSVEGAQILYSLIPIAKLETGLLKNLISIAEISNIKCQRHCTTKKVKETLSKEMTERSIGIRDTNLWTAIK